MVTDSGFQPVLPHYKETYLKLLFTNMFITVSFLHKLKIRCNEVKLNSYKSYFLVGYPQDYLL
jgi:hypothetical protein